MADAPGSGEQLWSGWKRFCADSRRRMCSRSLDYARSDIGTIGWAWDRKRRHRGQVASLFTRLPVLFLWPSPRFDRHPRSGCECPEGCPRWKQERRESGHGSFADDYKAEVVALWRTSGKSIPEVAAISA